MSTRFLALVLVCAAAAGSDWPRFRGPNGTGVDDSAALPSEIGASKNVAWKTPLPQGHSSPIVSAGRIFLTAAEDGKLYTLCLDSTTGRVLWKRECPRTRREELDKRNHPASPTPVADGKNVYVFFADYGLVSYDFNGVERWRTPLGPFQNLYGMGASPILAGDKVVLVCDQNTDSFIIALDRSDGRVRWKTPRPEALSGHSTPVIHQPKSGPPLILAPSSFRMDAYSADTGESVWWVTGLASEMKSTPVLAGETIFIGGYNTPWNDPGRQLHVPAFADVIASRDADKDGRISKVESPDERIKSFFPFIDLDKNGWIDAEEWRKHAASMAAENGLLAFRLGERGDSTGRLIWKYHRAVPQLPSPLLYDGVLYMINDGGVLTTLDPSTGALHKQGRLRAAVDRYYASPVAAGGKVFIVSHTGIVTVLKAGREQEVLSAGELEDECYATPAISNGRIYIRTRGALYCFGKKN